MRSDRTNASCSLDCQDRSSELAMVPFQLIAIKFTMTQWLNEQTHSSFWNERILIKEIRTHTPNSTLLEIFKVFDQGWRFLPANLRESIGFRQSDDTLCGSVVHTCQTKLHYRLNLLLLIYIMYCQTFQTAGNVFFHIIIRPERCVSSYRNFGLIKFNVKRVYLPIMWAHVRFTATKKIKS